MATKKSDNSFSQQTLLVILACVGSIVAGIILYNYEKADKGQESIPSKIVKAGEGKG